MGAGRKTLGSAPSSPNMVTGNICYRNLRKSHLGGVIFGCSNTTIKECLFKQLFGLPAAHSQYVQNIDPGLPLFLFNYSDRKLHGIFESASSGRMNINPYGWTTDGSERTQYPAQVQIRVRLQCQPLLEEQFRPIIMDNYYNHSHFWFELDHSQTSKLMSLLASLAVAPSTSVPQNTAKWRNIFRVIPSTDTKEEAEGVPLTLQVEHSNHSTKELDFADTGPSLDGTKEDDEGFKPIALEVDYSNHSSKESDSTEVAPSLDGDNQPLETHLDAKVVEPDEKYFILMKLKELALNRERQDFPLVSYVEDSAVMNDIHLEEREFPGEQVDSEESAVMNDIHLEERGFPGEKVGSEEAAVMNNINLEERGFPGEQMGNDVHLEERGFPGEQVGSEETSVGSTCSSSDYQSIIAQLIQGIEELKEFKTEQTLKMGYLEQKLVEAETEIQRLKDRCMILESMSNPSIEHADETVIDSCDKLHLDPTESIFLVGGYDGESWLSTLDSYFPSGDVIKSLMPMSSVRSYASVAKLNGELYVFGGGNGHSWYDTVESYSPTNDQWTLQPSLKEKKGSLAGATLDSKIFAIGGGNGVQCFSDVEMLDLDVGRWIATQSMLQKRFALAATELNGVLYATGGYDGNDYVTSAERFDPREHSWTKIASMNSKRGCHSLVVLNEKLYAVGGFNGSAMVPSVEIFDPRLGSWMSGDPMNQPRGYAAAAVVKESIYVIGGVIAGETILDTVERFEEGKGWQEIKAKATGKRCFMSAIAL